MHRFLMILTLLALTAGLAHAQTGCLWGSFDASRINYAAGPLTGTAHSVLRGIIAANGGVVAPAAPALTAAYLASVDVFYTSLLSTGTGTLSAAEQAALQAWITGGGTLIVTGDIFPLPAYESFTAFYGVTNYQALTTAGLGTTVGAHPITLGVTNFSYNTDCTYTFGAGALLLGRNVNARDFMIVMEPGTGFPAGGRILVTGDHNMFTDSMIAQADNTRLANNIALWACGGPTAVESTTWGQVKSVFRERP